MKKSNLLIIILIIFTSIILIYSTQMLDRKQDELDLYSAYENDAENLYLDSIELSNKVAEKIYQLYNLDNYLFESFNFGILSEIEADLEVEKFFWELNDVKIELLEFTQIVDNIFPDMGDNLVVYWYPDTIISTKYSSENYYVDDSFYFYFENFLDVLTDSSQSYVYIDEDFTNIFIIQIQIERFYELSNQYSLLVNQLSYDIQNFHTAINLLILSTMILTMVSVFEDDEEEDSAVMTDDGFEYEISVSKRKPIERIKSERKVTGWKLFILIYSLGILLYGIIYAWF